MPLQKSLHGLPQPASPVHSGPGGPELKETDGKMFLSSDLVLHGYGGGMMVRVTRVGVTPGVVDTVLAGFVMVNGGGRILLDRT